jgi:beta-phosphoglucomutase-like phosphatase (HAD superfamily)
MQPPPESHFAVGSTPAALIFDLDGTLADTMPAHYKAWTIVSQRHGLRFSPQRFLDTAGWPTARIAATLAVEQGVTIEPQEFSEEKNDLFLANLGAVQPIESVLDIARRHRNVVPMAIATGSRRRNAEAILEGLGIRNWFDVVLTSSDPVAPKPAPDMFLEIARQLGVPPGRCIVYEDGDPGLEGARAAGMSTVDVRRFPGYPRHDLGGGS